MRWLIIAQDEQNFQVEAFKEVRDSIPKATAKEYLAEVEAWEQDQSLPNPYALPTKGTLPF
jgi:hypothetical protein